MKRFGLVLLALALAGLASLGALYRWVNFQGRPDGNPVSVFIEQGTSGRAIAQQLEEKSVVDSALAFRIYLRTRNVNADLRAGKYELKTAMAFEDLVKELKRGPEVKFVKLVVPEGFTIDQTAAQVEKLTHIKAADFLAAASPKGIKPAILPPGVETLEGFLYPATYYVIEQETAEGLVKRMVAEFEKRSKAVGIDQASEVQRTPFEILVIASMIEEEAKEDPERDDISAVIHNRLKKGIPLGIDATIQYAVKKYHGEPLTESDLAIDSPFNSRLRQGLPPWPIASPRDKSIKAALNPAAVNFLYYVLKDCKTHLFTDDYDEFSRAKQRIPTNC